MTSHGAGVPEAEINVIAAVDVGEVRPAGSFYENGKSAGPFVHPVHGNAAEERGLCAKVEFSGARVLGDEAFFFARVEGVEFGAFDVGHVYRLQISGLAAAPA